MTGIFQLVKNKKIASLIDEKERCRFECSVPFHLYNSMGGKSLDFILIV